jgi:hypothetical protein
MILALPFLYPLLSPLSKLVMPLFRLSNPFLSFLPSVPSPNHTLFLPPYKPLYTTEHYAIDLPSYCYD